MRRVKTGDRIHVRRVALLLVNVGTFAVVSVLIEDRGDYFGTLVYLLLLFNSVGWLLCAAVDRWSVSFGRHRWWVLGLAEWLAFVWTLYGIAEGDTAVGVLCGAIRLADYGLRLWCPPTRRQVTEASP